MAAISVIPEDQWLNAQREYIECKHELKALALKYGVKYNTIRFRAFRGQWGRLRDEYRNKILSAPPVQVAEVLALAERPIVLNGHSQEHFQVGNQTYLDEIPELTRMIEIARRNYCNSVDADEGAKWARTYNQLMERKRVVMGIPLPAPVRQRERSVKGNTVVPIVPGPGPVGESEKV